MLLPVKNNYNPGKVNIILKKVINVPRKVIIAWQKVIIGRKIDSWSNAFGA
jgi:hypothetical protein